MTQEILIDTADSGGRRRGRGPAKPYPALNLEDVLVIPKTVSEHGIDGQLRRLTLFDRLGRKPDSGPSRQLITTSGRYGLTTGGTRADHITLTEMGRDLALSLPSTSDYRIKAFRCGIERFEIFKGIYEKLESQRLPARDVLCDELSQFGISRKDALEASEIFVSNARHIGLVREISGSETLISLEQLLEELPEVSEAATETDTAAPAPDFTREGSAEQDTSFTPQLQPAVNQPSLHIDINIHIDSAADAEQIDQIFASMGKHLYGRGG